MKKELAKNPRQRIQAGFAVRGSVVRRAVDRNRVRRLMREAYRLHKQVLSDLQHTDNQLRMIFLFSPNEKEFILPDYPTIEEDIKLFLHTIHSMLSS
jgi:ribonuclease P protein component